MPGGGTLTIDTANVHLDDDHAAGDTEVVPGEYVMLAVSDSGVGMSAEVPAHAMESFFTTKEVGKGTGLGLSMIYGFAKQSRGHLKIESKLDHETTIRLYLPRANTGQLRRLRRQRLRQIMPVAARRYWWSKTTRRCSC
jgi:signal transduction histidine kinase